MKKLLGIVVLGLLLSGNAYAANEGSGPIEFPEKFEKRFKAYLNYVKNEKMYSLLSVCKRKVVSHGNRFCSFLQFR